MKNDGEVRVDRWRQLRLLIHLAYAASTVVALGAVAGCGRSEPPVSSPPLVQRLFPDTEILRAPGGDQPVAATASAPTLKPTGTTARLPDAAKAETALGGAPASSPAAADRVTAVLLVVPAIKDGGLPGKRVFRVSLGNDLGEARIEFDGQDLPTSAIQRVYPQSRQLAPAVAAGRPPAPPRAWRQPSTADLTPRHASALNPNGAPIID